MQNERPAPGVPANRHHRRHPVVRSWLQQRHRVIAHSHPANITGGRRTRSGICTGSVHDPWRRNRSPSHSHSPQLGRPTGADYWGTTQAPSTAMGSSPPGSHQYKMKNFPLFLFALTPHTSPTCSYTAQSPTFHQRYPT